MAIYHSVNLFAITCNSDWSLEDSFHQSPSLCASLRPPSGHAHKEIVSEPVNEQQHAWGRCLDELPAWHLMVPIAAIQRNQLKQTPEAGFFNVVPRLSKYMQSSMISLKLSGVRTDPCSMGITFYGLASLLLLLLLLCVIIFSVHMSQNIEVSIKVSSSFVFLRQCLSLNPEVTDCLDWFSYLCTLLPSAKVTCAHRHTQLLTWVLKSWAQLLMSTRQALDQLSYIPRPSLAF